MILNGLRYSKALRYRNRSPITAETSKVEINWAFKTIINWMTKELKASN
jgi:hypothetical protein